MENEELRSLLEKIYEASDESSEATNHFARWFFEQDKFFSVAYAILSDPEDARDVLQKVAIRLTVDGVKPPRRNVFNWCRTIVANESKDMIGSRKRDQQQFDTDAELQEYSNPVSERPGYELTQEDLSHVLELAIKNTLTPIQKNIMLLAKQGYKNTEIAKELGVSKRTVERERSRGYKKIRPYISKNFPEYSLEGGEE